MLKAGGEVIPVIRKEKGRQSRGLGDVQGMFGEQAEVGSARGI